MSHAFRRHLPLLLAAVAAAAAACGGAPAAAKLQTATTAQIEPASATVTAGQTAAFIATFSGPAPTAVTWSATGGTIAGSSTNANTATAEFTAGTAAGTYTIALTAASPATITATATVLVEPAPPSTTTTGTGTTTTTTTTATGGTSTTATAPSNPAPTPEFFTSPSAGWLYAAPTGSGLNISSMVAGLDWSVNTHDGGFDYPVEGTDGTQGCTTFTDTLIYNYTDDICVPNPDTGVWTPSTGGWGSDDGHLVIVDTTTGTYYDFWKLYVNSAGQPTSNNVGQIVSGQLAASNGNPGTTAANITGLAGDIMPGELDCATCLNHAVILAVPGSMNSNQVGTQAPATKTDGTVAGGIFREGAKIAIASSVDIGSLGVSTAVQALLRALQLYGGVIVDQTGADSFGFYSDLPTQPDLTGINDIGQYLLIYY